MLSLHLQKCAVTLSIDIPDLNLNLRITTITKQFEMYPHVESYIMSFALIAIPFSKEAHGKSSFNPFRICYFCVYFIY
jgi:hypothetical protein